jgi:TolB-like protein/DNA-binding SARP family transcriptional activator
MIDFTTLGTVDLRRDGEELRSVLLQPKRLAVLAYLVTASPRGFHSRDTLLGLFWPDLDQERARNAMRQALHFLRRAVGDDVVASRGDREVGVTSGAIACDAVAFDEALAAGRLEAAAGLYRGDFLPGLFIEEAPDAERWLEAERARRKERVLEALRELVTQEEGRGELRAAVLWARRAVAIAPTDDGAVRRLMTVLDRAGEPAAALDAYDHLVHRLREEFGVPPAGETIRLVNEIRNRPGDVATAPAAMQDLPATPAVAVAPRVSPPPRSAPLPVAASPRRRWLPALALAAALSAGTFALRRPAAATPDTTPSSIAVLPFANLSGDATNDYLSDGFTEEVLNALAGIEGLSVAARTSSFRFKGVDAPVDSIARALHVGHVLEGSVRRDGERIRVTAQLIDAASGFHIWSETYERSLGDLFAVQDEISRAIALRLRDIPLDGAPAAPETADAEAHALYLQARQASRLGMAHSAQTIVLLEQALARDPGYARARGQLALTLAYEAYARRLPVEPTYARARAEAERALASREVAEAHMTLGRIADVRDWNFAAADRHYARAIALSPSSAGAYVQRARLLLRLGKTDEALAVGQRAVQLDPLSQAAHNGLAGIFALSGRHADAVASYRSALALVPGDAYFHSNLALSQAELGDTAGAMASLAQARTTAPVPAAVRSNESYVLARLGMADSARVLLAQLERDDQISPMLLASTWIVLGERERALDALERAAATRDDYLTDLKVVREFETLRDDPRFVALVKRLGL